METLPTPGQDVGIKETTERNDVLPDFAVNEFARRSRRRPKINHAPRFNIGEHLWKEDATDSATVFEALSTLKFSDLGTDYERNRFGATYQSWWLRMRFLQQDTWVLDANQLLLARQLRIILRLPSLTEDNLDDRNRGDMFVKAVAVCQTA